MNKRSREILSCILTKKNCQQELTLDELTKLYGVSSRTIRYDIEQINYFLDNKKVSRIVIGKKGILQTKEDFYKCREYLLAEGFYTFKLSKHEREVFIVTMLVCTNDFLTLSEIADKLLISRSTTIQDVERVKGKVKQWGINLNSYPNRGLLIEGREWDKRKLILHLIRSCKAIFRDGALFVHLMNIISEHSGDCRIDKEMIEKILNEAEHTFGLFLTDDDFNQTVYYLIFALCRMQQGCNIECYIANNAEAESMSLDILKKLNIFTGILISPGEVAFLGALLKEVRYLKKIDSNKEIVKIQIIARRFIEEVSVRLNINLNSDYIFYEKLANHLESIFTKLNNDIEINSILEDILDRYPDVLVAARECSYILEDYIDRRLGESEIAFITCHICAAIERHKNSKNQYFVLLVCHGGVGTSQLLVERLRKYFNFHIVDVVSAHDLPEQDMENVDLIISTVPLKNAPIQYIQVSTMLSDKDCINVSHVLSSIKGHELIDEQQVNQNQLIKRLQLYIDDYSDKGELKRQVTLELENFFKLRPDILLTDLLETDAINLDLVCSDWKEAVRFSADYLLSNGYIEARYVDAMIDNISQNGPYIVLAPGFAMPHEAIDAGVNKLGMSLIRLKKPVKFYHELYDPIKWVCCICTIDRESHLKAIFTLVNLLHNKSFRMEIDKAVNAAQVAAIIRKYESR